MLRYILIFSICAGSAWAQEWRNPESKFSTDLNLTNNIIIEWLVAENVQLKCESESRKRSLGGFGFGLDACSFWSSSKCTIVTSRNPTIHQLGHEVRHCFQGKFH